jgi:hypothetical protein
MGLNLKVHFMQFHEKSANENWTRPARFAAQPASLQTLQVYRVLSYVIYDPILLCGKN